MNHRVIVFLFLSFSNIFFSKAQSPAINEQKGFVAEGYDVVAYFSNKSVEGSDDYVFEFEGHSYKFSSIENLNIFKSQPEKYMPQYGGYCAWAIADKGRKVGINPKSFEIRNEKLYLFYHTSLTNTLKKWQKANTDELVNKADSIWDSIKYKNH